MKVTVTPNDIKFQAIKVELVLENQDEVQALYAVVNLSSAVSGLVGKQSEYTTSEKANKVLFEMWDKLYSAGITFENMVKESA